MASAGRIQITQDEIRGCTTMREALVRLIQLRGLPAYPQWQSMFFGLIREHGFAEDPDAMPGTSLSDKQAHAHDLWQEIMSIAGDGEGYPADERGDGSMLPIADAVQPNAPLFHAIATPSQEARSDHSGTSGQTYRFGR